MAYHLIVVGTVEAPNVKPLAVHRFLKLAIGVGVLVKKVRVGLH